MSGREIDRIAVESALMDIEAAFHAFDAIRRALEGDTSYPGDVDALRILADVGLDRTHDAQTAIFGAGYVTERKVAGA